MEQGTRGPRHAITPDTNAEYVGRPGRIGVEFTGCAVGAGNMPLHFSDPTRPGNLSLLGEAMSVELSASIEHVRALLDRIAQRGHCGPQAMAECKHLLIAAEMWGHRAISRV